jgi:alkanesulfonate monooxygenase SsuD/methylene tetrahydromethanopterin reductase-like flavin-dependent oxidoreductase (luciferase family)
MERATAELRSGRAGGKDGTFEFARDVVRRADELGFDTTLIAERFLGPDLEAWVLAAALAVVTKRIELLVAVHPGMVTPQVVAKMGGADGKVVVPDAGDIVAKPAQLPYPPIYAASRSPEGKAMIARHCDVGFAEYKPGYRNFESNIESMSTDLRAMDALAARRRNFSCSACAATRPSASTA